MIAWRIVKARRADEILRGEGSRKYGGRWNHVGASIVYASSTLSLAALEVFVRLDRYEQAMRFMAVELYIPDELVIVLDPHQLPDNWTHSPSLDACKDMGSKWAREQQSLALLVPSVIVPIENNMLISTEHAAFASVKIASKHDFTFGGRMWKQRAASSEQRAESREQRAESREQRAESSEQRAESRQQRTIGRVLRAFSLM